LSLSIEAGSRVAILGQNGIGKTTLVRCLLQELALDSGKIRWASWRYCEVSAPRRSSRLSPS
jgi:ABC-type multidrug transport system ATPase subunit